MIDSIMYVTVLLVMVLLYTLQFCLFARALMSWFATDEDSGIARFLYVITEPFVAPVRNLLSRIEFFSSLPVDMSFIITFFIVMILTTILGGF